MMRKKILVTGGAGFIGSHTCIELIENDYDVLIIDNFSNSDIVTIKNIELITKNIVRYECVDIRDKSALKSIFSNFRPDCVLHFAGLKAVKESVLMPLNYYEVNLMGTMNILALMSVVGCYEFIFSSSATIYGDNDKAYFNEKSQVNPVSPYGRTKLFTEALIKDWVATMTKNRAIVMRYFNPIGAHQSGLIGESPKDEPNNLMPIILKVVNKLQQHLLIFGNDYPTRDGTGLRDYIHVCDLAIGHVLALKKINDFERFEIFNLGCGIGYTVKELVHTFEKVNDVHIPTKLTNRRPGDVAVSLADISKASEMLGFKSLKSLEDMCKDAWRWNSLQ